MCEESYAGIIGTKFLGRAHSNAFIAVCCFFWSAPAPRAADGLEDVYLDFYDGLRCQQVLDVPLKSAVEGRWVEIPAEE